RTLRKRDGLGQELPLRLIRSGDRCRLEFDPGLARIQRRREEIVIVDAGESKYPLVHRLRDEIVAGNPLDVAVAVINPLWRLNVISGEETAAAGARADIAEAGAPDNRRIQWLSVVLDARRERDQVVRRIEAEFLARAQRRGLEFEHHHPFAGSRIDAITGVAHHLVQRAVELPGDRLIVNAKRERRGSVGGQRRRNEIDRLSLSVAILLQPPMRNPAAPVCQTRLCRGGLDDDFPFRGIADNHRRIRDGRRGRFGDGRRRLCRGLRGRRCRAWCGAARRLGRRRRRRHEERLVTVKNEERKEDCDENSAFHQRYRGTGSTPWRPSGWQRESLCAPSQSPRPAPYSSTASFV